MEKAKRIEVRRTHFPDITRMGFKLSKDENCVEPYHEYKKSEQLGGYCHIQNAEEMNRLAERVGAMKREQFQEEKDEENLPWKNAYAEHLSEKVGIALQRKEGIEMEINGEKVCFYCPKGKFVRWKINKKVK